MRKLYWKIFIWFWLAMCLTIVVIALVSSQVTQQSSGVDFEHYSFNRGNIIFRFSIAILIGGFICYLLSLYLLRPIRILQRAAKKLGQGEFQTRVQALLGHRKDEIGELARDFDEMAARLESLVLSKQQLLQDISHELRSPLARLSVALEIARDKSPAVEKELTRIAYETDKLNELIRQLLSLASLDASQNVVTFEKVDLVELVDSIVSDANYEIQHRIIPIRLITPQACDAEICYPLLRSAIENIIRNALRYTPEDQPIQVTVLSKEEEIQISIEDSGPGIPEEKLAQVFDPFFRVDDSRTQNTGGFGLGLAIAKRAILLHQGNISAQNLPRGGLNVTLTFPIKQS
ncbi:MAG: ATP-binding protein [Pseudomonadota bacterium]